MSVALDKDKLTARIETQTQGHVLAEARRLNAAAARSDAAPVADVLTEVYDTPDEKWPAARLRTVVLALRRDYVAALLPHLDEATHTVSPDAPSDDDLRERLKRSSATFATMARSNQHKSWFEFFTRRDMTPTERDDAMTMFELRVAVEQGKISEEDAKAEWSKTRAGVMQKARALERLDELKGAAAEGARPTRKQVKEARAAADAVTRAEAEAREPSRRVRGRPGVDGRALAERFAARRAAGAGEKAAGEEGEGV